MNTKGYAKLVAQFNEALAGISGQMKNRGNAKADYCTWTRWLT